MSTNQFIEQEFVAIPKSDFEKGTYESCVFTRCDFSGTDLLDVVFSECEFNDCNFSSANLNNTAFRDIQFNNCKLLGLHFEDCNDFLFAINMNHCIVDFSSFYKRNMKKAHLTECSLKEVDFSEADLSSAVFISCNLAGALFERTNLEKADLRKAFNYSIDPEKNRLTKAKFSLESIAGLLDKYKIVIEK